MIKFYAQQLTFSDGSQLDLKPGAVVVVVGPNNSGKSETLRNLFAGFGSQPLGPSITKMTVAMDGTEEEFITWAETNTISKINAGGVLTWRRLDQSTKKDVAVAGWNARSPTRQLRGLLALSAYATERLSLVADVASFNPRLEDPSNPLQYLYQFPEVEREIASAVRASFGTGVVIDRIMGSAVGLLYGEQPKSAGSFPPSTQYQAELSALTPVHEQGDGIKAYVGLLLLTRAIDFPVLIVDEPEAFLHPPQAKQLGIELGKGRRGDGQLFIATHSSDVLEGLLSAPGASVEVVRLTRSEDSASVSTLSADAVSELWKDPLLRYSGVLDGLFHDLVVVCESDADCLFFEAVYDEISANRPDERCPEVLFVHAGGKDRLHQLAKAMTQLSVPVKVIADIDLLRESHKVRKPIEALGGDWSVVESEAVWLKNQVDAIPSTTKVLEVKEKLDERLANLKESDFIRPEDTKALRESLKIADGWDNLKSSGVAALPNGDVTRRAKELIRKMESIGLFVLDVGEIEGFGTELGGHGPKWTARALESELHKDTLGPAATLITRVVGLK